MDHNEFQNLTVQIQNVNQLINSEANKQEALRLQSESILKEYNVSSLEELEALYLAKTQELNTEVLKAKDYLSEANQYLANLQSIHSS